MTHPASAGRRTKALSPDGYRESGRRILTDGGGDPAAEDGENADDPEAESTTEDDRTTSTETSNVEVTAPGEAEPADPKWERPDIDDVPEVEGPKTRPADSSGRDAASEEHVGTVDGSPTPPTGDSDERSDDPTAGMPNTARSPGQSRLKEGGADGYVAALELCARLPDDVRLPEEAADLVPVALEAELEQDVQSFAAEEFDNPAPHVETLEFVEVDGELWLRLRLGIDAESFADLDPEEIRDHALQQVNGLL